MGVIYSDTFANLNDYNVVTTSGTVTNVAGPQRGVEVDKDGTTNNNSNGIISTSMRAVSLGNVFYYRIRTSGTDINATCGMTLKRDNVNFILSGDQYGFINNGGSWLLIDGDWNTTLTGALGGQLILNRWYDWKIELRASDGKVAWSRRDTPDSTVPYDANNQVYDATVVGNTTFWSAGGSYAFMVNNTTLNRDHDIMEFYQTNNGFIIDPSGVGSQSQNWRKRRQRIIGSN